MNEPKQSESLPGAEDADPAVAYFGTIPGRLKLKPLKWRHDE
jgi:hypothetical protein